MVKHDQVPRLSLAALIFCFSFLCPQNTVSQNIVSVNNLTGTANITVPIYNVTVGDLSSPIALSYSASGLKVEDYDNTFGQGWRLIADASITRDVRGFPDDVDFSSSPAIKGWIRSGNGAPATIQSLSIANDGTLNCANEITDATAIANNFTYTSDTEPDRFYISAPGLSCSFVFDASTTPLIKTIPYRDYKITYTTDAAGRIASFTVINEKGIKYYFDRTYLVDHYCMQVYPNTTVTIDPQTLEVFKRDFLMYSKLDNIGAHIKYYDKWMLTKMEDTRGNSIIYTYDNYTIPNPEILKRYSYKEIEILKPDGSGGFTKKFLYGITTARIEFHLTSIKTVSLGPGDLIPINIMAQFYWETHEMGSTEDVKLSRITLPKEKKIYELLFTKKFLGSQTVWNNYGRYFLKGIKSYKPDNLCDKVNTQFDFTYYNVNEANNTCYCTPVYNNQTIDTIINAQDYWGYYNGNYLNPDLNPTIWAYPDHSTAELFKIYPIPGGSPAIIPATADRSVNTHAIDGSLKTITYPNGAVTELKYENNEFYDNDVNGNVLGGGIRVKQISNNDGLNNNDITYYGYNDLTNTSNTTGRAISVPKFTMAFQNSNSYGNITDKVKNSTYRTTFDLNPESKEILYGKVTVRKTNNGKSVYEYNTTGTFRGSAVTDWEETMDWIARNNLSSPTPCNAILPSFLNNGNLQYPFAPNANFDFERGLLNKVTSYNEAGAIVATEEYTYSRSHETPTKIYGLKLDEIGNTMDAYGRYAINTVVDNFLVNKVSKVFNSTSPSSTVYVKDEEDYKYTATNSSLTYRLLKEVKKSTNDVDIKLVSRFKYAKEYTTTPTSIDEMNNAILNFNDNNNNVLIETSQHRVDEGTSPSETTLGASLNTFKLFTIGDPANTTIQAYLPYSSYQFINQAGINNFVPSVLSGGTFTKDAHYVNTPVSIEKYSVSGIPQLITDNSRIPKTVISAIDREMKLAEFVNARPENIGFSNFEYESAGNFTIGPGNSTSIGGRSSSACINFQPNTSICRVLTKSTTSNSLVISFWLKDATANGEIYLCYGKYGQSTCTGDECTSNPIISFNAGSEWKYYQVIIPWINPGTVTTRYYSLGTSTEVKIDDVMIYPANAGVTTYSFTSNAIGLNMLTAKTGVNGIGNTYEYDNAGRLWLVKDQFGNIIEMKKYKLANRHIQQLPTFYLGRSPLHPVAPATVEFTVSLPASYDFGDCAAPPIAYKWNFGDGSPEVTVQGDQNGGATLQHIYENAGKYQITVTASSPDMTDVVVQTPPTSNTSPPLPFEVFTYTASCTGGGTPVICAAGITQYTSAYQCVLSYCSPMAAVCNNTNFKLTGITSGSMNDVYSVTWEKAPEGTSDWAVWQQEITSPGGFETSHSFHNVHTTSYQMRAKIRYCAANGSTAYSNVIHVINGD